MKRKLYEFSSRVGMNIKLERIKQKIKQEELAFKANLSRTTLGSIERGESSPTVETVKSIADALNIEVHKLFIFS